MMLIQMVGEAGDNCYLIIAYLTDLPHSPPTLIFRLSLNSHL